MKQYKTLLIDPPWSQGIAGDYRNRPNAAQDLPYKTLSLDAIGQLPIQQWAHPEAHIWLWTTNQFLAAGFDLLKRWGCTYLAPIHAIKPSGMGNYFVHRTQTLLFAYKDKCVFPLERFRDNIIEVGNPKRHSQKWEKTYEYIESISPPPRLELFARKTRKDWDVWGDEVDHDIPLLTPLAKVVDICLPV